MNLPDSLLIAENVSLRQEIVKAQAVTSAWHGVFETIEAHLLDRINMRDPGEPENYLGIIQNAIENIKADSLAIGNARWADYARHEDQIKRLSRIIIAILEADERGQGTPFAEAMDAAAKAVGRERT